MQEIKTKLYIFLFLISLSHLAFGQASGSSDFFISVAFEEDIPVNEIEFFYYQTSNNNIERISFKSDSLKNTIKVLGHHSYVVGAGFPVIVFSHKGKKIYDSYFDGSINPRTEKEITEIQNLYYLVVAKDEFITSDENFNMKLKFSNEMPNIIIRYENINGKIRYDVSNEPHYFLSVYEMPISNQLVKVNQKNED